MVIGVPGLQRLLDDFPDAERETEYLSLRTGSGYPIEAGTIRTSGGLAFPASEFDQHITEEHLARSTALHARLDGRGHYLTGPLARYALCFDQLSPLAREAAAAAGLGPLRALPRPDHRARPAVRGRGW